MPSIVMLRSAPVEGRIRSAGEELTVSDDCARLLIRSGQATIAPPKIVKAEKRAVAVK